jgi:hypothetical protein
MREQVRKAIAFLRENGATEIEIVATRKHPRLTFVHSGVRHEHSFSHSPRDRGQNAKTLIAGLRHRLAGQTHFRQH